MLVVRERMHGGAWSGIASRSRQALGRRCRCFLVQGRRVVCFFFFFKQKTAYEMYALHPRDELETFCRAAREHGVKTEVECFYTGAYWNLQFIRRLGLLDDPIWATIFLGWQGGAWTPPTHDALLFMVRHLPAGVN